MVIPTSFQHLSHQIKCKPINDIEYQKYNRKRDENCDIHFTRFILFHGRCCLSKCLYFHLKNKCPELIEGTKEIYFDVGIIQYLECNARELRTCNSIMAYSNNAPNTKNIQQITQDCIAFNPSAFGEFVVVVLKMFTQKYLKYNLQSML